LTTGEQFVALDPVVPEFDGQNLTWLFANLNPESDTGFSFIRPATWRALLERRAAAAQNPEDAGAHLELGRIYQELASVSSPRRDNFLAQAVAEFETAARLEPGNVRALTTLAELYETRAGAPTTIRDVNYIALAMEQWHKLVGTEGDARARQQLAEDSFYLALDAKAHEDYDRALKLLDDARTFAPGGAGPLYTPEHWENEHKFTNILAARAALMRDDMPRALEHTRAAYGDEFQQALPVPVPSFALTRASVTTTPGERRIVLQIVPYPALDDGTRAVMRDLAVALEETGAGTATVEEDATSFTLTLRVLFNGENDLRNRLTLLGNAIPRRADWQLARAAISPQELELVIADESWARRVHYREVVDVSQGQAAVQDLLNALSRSIGELSAAPPDDSQAQLRLALVTHAQEWWQKALGSLVLAYRLDAGGASREWAISLTAPRTLEYDAETIRPEAYIVGGAGAVAALLVLLGAGVVLLRRKGDKK
jgi:hypothetical protein